MSAGRPGTSSPAPRCRSPHCWPLPRGSFCAQMSRRWRAAHGSPLERSAIPNGAVSVALPDGRVLVAGGTSDGALSSGISTYDPASGAWAPGGNLAVARSRHAATVLKDGRVLIAGGTASVRSVVRHRDLRPGERHVGARRRHDAGARRPRRRDAQGRPRAHRRRFRRCRGAEPCRDLRSRDGTERGALPASCPRLASRPRPRRCSTDTCSWSAATTAPTISHRPRSSIQRPARSSPRARCRLREAVTWPCCCRTTTRS